MRDLETDELVEYTLVGSIEANPGQGRVSVDAPVGHALTAATPGDVVNVACPNGNLRFEVLGVETLAPPRRKAA